MVWEFRHGLTEFSGSRSLMSLTETKLWIRAVVFSESLMQEDSLLDLLLWLLAGFTSLWSIRLKLQFLTDPWSEASLSSLPPEPLDSRAHIMTAGFPKRMRELENKGERIQDQTHGIFLT